MTNLINGVDLFNISSDKNKCIQEGFDLKHIIVYLRPGHKSGIPQIYSEFKDGKYIWNNYGHGGIGYSVIFGSINMAIENIMSLKSDLNLDKSQEITIIGLGCIRLYTALQLNSIGYTNLKIIGEKYENTPSQNAGGLFELIWDANHSTEDIHKLKNMFFESFKEYKKITEKTNKIINEGVKYVDFYFDEINFGFGLSYLSEMGLIPSINKINLGFERNKSNIFEVYHSKTFHIVEC